MFTYGPSLESELGSDSPESLQAWAQMNIYETLIIMQYITWQAHTFGLKLDEEVGFFSPSLFSWHNTLNSSNAICCLFRKDGRRVYVVYVCACWHVVWRGLLIRHSPGKKEFCNIKSPELSSFLKEGKILNELVKAMLLQRAHSRENPPFIPPPSPGWVHAHVHTDVHAYVHIHTAEGHFHLMVFPQQNSSVLGFGSPIFFSPPCSPPPTLEAGLCQRAEEASELVEGSPQQRGTESCPQRSSQPWLFVSAQVKQHKNFPHCPTSSDFELPFFPRQAHIPGLCTLCELDFLLSLHQSRDAQTPIYLCVSDKKPALLKGIQRWQLAAPTIVIQGSCKELPLSKYVTQRRKSCLEGKSGHSIVVG